MSRSFAPSMWMSRLLGAVLALNFVLGCHEGDPLYARRTAITSAEGGRGEPSSGGYGVGVPGQADDAAGKPAGDAGAGASSVGTGGGSHGGAVTGAAGSSASAGDRGGTANEADGAAGEWREGGAGGADQGCVEPPECIPGSRRLSEERCPGGACGWTMTRDCSLTCEWEDWVVYSSSCVPCTACARVVYCDAPDDLPGVGARGTWCRQDTAACSEEEVLDDCRTEATAVCGTLYQPLYIEYSWPRPTLSPQP